MFGFLFSQEKKMRDNARNWLELADKVWHYRRDVLPPRDTAELQKCAGELRDLLKAKSDAAKLKLAIEGLEGVLQRVGTGIYPKTSLVDNVEFFLVAAIVILGIRTYFVQPFKIPTNSMWPSYYGMTAENFPVAGESPGLAAQAFRFVAFGAQPREVIAPIGGDVSIDFDLNRGTIAFAQKADRKWLVIPTTVREYTFFVGGEAARVRVPADFNDFDRVVAETFFGSEQAFSQEVLRSIQAAVQQARRNGTVLERSSSLRLALKPNVQKGAPILRFDVMTGDQLFVDRVSFHFIRPTVGQGFVFRTDHIPAIGDEQYYIKRLAGSPGDVLEIREPVLFRNGAPITGARSYELNATRTAPFRGYQNARESADPASPHYLRRGEQVKVPERSFMALGDNSYNSLDSRAWGFVPDKDAVGRPLFIYYPFTKRWGPAR